jgi:hypothetical protein
VHGSYARVATPPTTPLALVRIHTHATQVFPTDSIVLKCKFSSMTLRLMGYALGDAPEQLQVRGFASRALSAHVWTCQLPTAEVGMTHSLL